MIKNINKNVLNIFIITLIFALNGCNLFKATENDSVYYFILSWQNDPTSTMTIDWLTEKDSQNKIEYRVKGETLWIISKHDSFGFPYSDRLQNRSELVGLKPDTKYEFRINNGDVYKFRTMPNNLNRSIKFAAGGDMMHRKDWMINTNQSVAHYDLDFVIIGGDLAYADGLSDNVHRWYDFMEIWSNTMKTQTGRIIPLLVSIGNHEVKKGYVSNYKLYEQTDSFRMMEAPYFFTLFAFPGQPGYNVLDFGDYLTLVALDTGHINPISGIQKDWLKETLGDRQGKANIIPFYHVPAYPSFRNFNDSLNVEVRTHWVTLFEQNQNINVVFENHDHTYKRTYPLKNNIIDLDGIHYIGDGAWGVETREVRDGLWYLAEARSVRHFILVEITEENIYINAIDENGYKIDYLKIEL